MGNSDSSISGGLDGTARLAIRRHTYSNVLRNPEWVKALKNNSEAGDSTIWRHSFQNPQPAFIVNPQFGMCLIWSRETNVHPITRQQRQYYLVTFVRAVKSGRKTQKPVLPKGAKKLKLRSDKFYKVPATITMYDGVEVEYIIPLSYIISKIYNGDSSDASVIIVDVRSREKIERMTLEEFQTVMKAKPPKPVLTRGYREAFMALYATNPAYVATHLLSSEVVISKGAEPFLISTTSKEMVEDETSVIPDRTQASIGSLFESSLDIQSQQHMQNLRMFHPPWYHHDSNRMRELDLSFTRKTIHSSIHDTEDSFSEHDGIVALSSRRKPGSEIFGPVTKIQHRVISQYNNYIE